MSHSIRLVASTNVRGMAAVYTLPEQFNALDDSAPGVDALANAKLFAAA